MRTTFFVACLFAVCSTINVSLDSTAVVKAEKHHYLNQATTHISAENQAYIDAQMEAYAQESESGLRAKIKSMVTDFKAKVAKALKTAKPKFKAELEQIKKKLGEIKQDAPGLSKDELIAIVKSLVTIGLSIARLHAGDFTAVIPLA